MEVELAAVTREDLLEAKEEADTLLKEWSHLEGVVAVHWYGKCVILSLNRLKTSNIFIFRDPMVTPRFSGLEIGSYQGFEDCKLNMKML